MKCSVLNTVQMGDLGKAHRQPEAANAGGSSFTPCPRGSENLQLGEVLEAAVTTRHSSKGTRLMERSSLSNMSHLPADLVSPRRPQGGRNPLATTRYATTEVSSLGTPGLELVFLAIPGEIHSRYLSVDIQSTLAPIW